MIARRHNTHSLEHAIRRLWLGGLNTYEIGKRLGVSEAVVANAWHARRERLRSYEAAR